MSSPKFFRVEPSDDALIIAAVANIHGLVEDEVRDECDSLLEQLEHTEIVYKYLFVQVQQLLKKYQQH